MNIQLQRLCIYSSCVFLVCFGVGFALLAQFIPPISPAATAVEVAEIYQQNTLPIRFGLLISMAGVGFIVPFGAAIAMQMTRIEGKYPVMAWTQFGSNALGALFFGIPVLIMLAVAFRPDRDPQLLMLLNDLGWLCLTVPFTFGVVQFLSIGALILSSKNEALIYPRWLGYLNLWVAVLVMPGGMAAFFKTGPLAWDGLLAFWLALIVFSVWFMVMIIETLKAINSQEAANE